MKPSFKPRARITGYSPQLHLQAKIRFKTSESIPTKKYFRPNFFDFVIFHYFGHFGWKKKQSPTKKFYTGKMFDFEIFVLIYVSKHSESIPTKKASTKIFLTKAFFHYFGHFCRKKQSPTRKFYTGKNFRFWDFCFKIRFKAFWSDSDQKNFRPKFFDFVIFSLFWSFWPKKTKSDEKNFTREKIFDFEILVLIYFLKHSESIPTKKIFDQNFLTLSFFHYFGHFGRKN